MIIVNMTVLSCVDMLLNCCSVNMIPVVIFSFRSVFASRHVMFFVCSLYSLHDVHHRCVKCGIGVRSLRYFLLPLVDPRDLRPDFSAAASGVLLADGTGTFSLYRGGGPSEIHHETS